MAVAANKTSMQRAGRAREPRANKFSVFISKGMNGFLWSLSTGRAKNPEEVETVRVFESECGALLQVASRALNARSASGGSCTRLGAHHYLVAAEEGGRPRRIEVAIDRR